MLTYRRRFVVSGGLPRQCDSVKFLSLEEYYIKEHSPPLCLRIIDFCDGVKNYELVADVKYAGQFVCEEYIWPLSCMLDNFIISGKTFVINKHRYKWKEGTFIIKIDIFNSETKIIAEVDGNDDIGQFQPPANWHEVTNDNRFSNFALVANGWPTTR